MSRTKFMGIFLVILGVISIVVGIVRGDMFSSATMCIGYLLPIVLGVVMLIVERVGGGEDRAGDQADPTRRWPTTGTRRKSANKPKRKNSRHPVRMAAAVGSAQKSITFLTKGSAA